MSEGTGTGSGIRLLPADLSNWQPPEMALPQDHSTSGLDARGADWRGLVLPAINLEGARLCRVDLRGADLTACKLDGADLRLARYDSSTRVPAGFELRRSGAVGPGAVLNGAFLNAADLRGMDLRDANLMGAYLSGADLRAARLDRARLLSADLRFACLQGAVCRAARFGGCQLQQADLRAADLEEAALEEAESIAGACFSLCVGLEQRQLQALLNRSHHELDCWNPISRQTTRTGLQSLLDTGRHTPMQRVV